MIIGGMDIVQVLKLCIEKRELPSWEDLGVAVGHIEHLRNALNEKINNDLAVREQTNTTPIEAVARAISKAHGMPESIWRDWIDEAKDAIDALGASVSDEMARAADGVLVSRLGRHQNCPFASSDIHDAIAAAIRAAKAN